jgi:hypothetical protein
MPKVQKQKPPIDEWACAPREKQTRCVTCLDPKVTALIHRVLVLRAEGKSQRSYSELYRKLVAEYGYTWTYACMTNHIRGCEAALWSKTRER